MKANRKSWTVCGTATLPLAMLSGMLLSTPHAPVAAQPDVQQPGLGPQPGGPQPGGPFARPRAEGRGEVRGEGRVEGRAEGRNEARVLPRPGNERDIRATIEQRRAEIGERSQQMRDSMVRQSLTRQGINDEKTHNLVIEHLRAQDKAKQAVQDKADKLRPALQNTETMADAQFNALLNEYLAAIEDYQDQRKKAADDLDGKLGYTKKPRLHAVLLMLGVVGDAPQQGSVINMPGMTFAMAGNAGAVQLPFRGGMMGGLADPGAPAFGGGPAMGFPGFGGAVGGGLVPPGFGGEGGFANAAPNDRLMNERIEAMRQEFATQIKQLREEMAQLKADKRER